MLKEFKAFVMKGNVLDLAVGIIIGAAFGKVVTSFVSDILMPPVGLLLGKVDFSNLFINLSGKSFDTLVEAKKAGAPTLNYGLFINTTIDFLIVGFAVFLLVKVVSRLQKQETPPPPTSKECPFCVSSIPTRATRCPFCTSTLPPAA